MLRLVAYKLLRPLNVQTGSLLRPLNVKTSSLLRPLNVKTSSPQATKTTQC